MSQIAIVGSGSMAQALGRALHLRGATIVALAGRDHVRSARAAAFIAEHVRTATFAELPSLASHLIVAVSDEAIPMVAEDLFAAGMRSGTVLHTSGASGPEALEPLRTAGVACGLIHPLQTVPSPELGAARLDRIAFGIAGDPIATAWAEDLVRLLHGRILRISPETLPTYHAAAALASNAIPALMDAAVALMQRAGVDSLSAVEGLSPLCLASVDNVATVGPLNALTGPVARGDAATVRMHVHALARTERPDIADLYVAVSRYLVDMARRRGLDEAKAGRLENILGGGSIEDIEGGMPSPANDGEPVVSSARNMREAFKERA